MGKKLADEGNLTLRRMLLIISLFTNLGMLAYFKYANFAIININALLKAASLNSFVSLIEVTLPVGISFYTFQSMSYTIDLYRNNTKAYKNFIPFATYISFFPQLIAGPIIRHTDLVKQLQMSAGKKTPSIFIAKGIYLLIIGLSKKILIADRIAAAIDPVIAQMSIITTLEAWACALGYTFQLYFDFSGYSDMAIGLGFIFGLKFPQNFNSPYKSYSITDFWRRWHMTLSSWLRDYLYISLGGNKKGHTRTYINLSLTMLLGGLWHGAAWTYVVWGGFHGAILAIERKFKLDRIPQNKFNYFARGVITFLLVLIGWVFFRSENLDTATLWLNKLFSFEGGFKMIHFSARTRDRFALATIIAIIVVWFNKNTWELTSRFTSERRKALFVALLGFSVLLFLGGESPFLYFQF